MRSRVPTSSEVSSPARPANLLRRCALILPLLWLGCRYYQESAYLRHLDQARYLARRRRYDAAVPEFDQALKIRPEALGIQLERIASLTHTDQLARAAGLIEDLRRRFPTSARVQYAAGCIAFAQGDRDRARQHFLATLELDPKDLDALVALGRLNLSADRFQDAQTYYARARSLAQDQALIHEAEYALRWCQLKTAPAATPEPAVAASRDTAPPQTAAPISPDTDTQRRIEQRLSDLERRHQQAIERESVGLQNQLQWTQGLLLLLAGVLIASLWLRRRV